MMYTVPKVPLIPQTKNMACWYASAQMVIQWRREKTQSCEIGITDPSEDPPSVQKWKANDGINDAFIAKLAADLGLKAVPPMCPTADAILSWLRSYGPLWVNGKTHITVIAGINTDLGLLWVHNPAPVNVGQKEWRPMEWLLGVGKAAGKDSLDPNATTAVFLHCPA